MHRCNAFGEAARPTEQHPECAPERSHLIRAQAAAHQTNTIERNQPRSVSLHETVWRDVLSDDGSPSDKRLFADADELVNGGVSAQPSAILDFHVSRERRGVGHSDIVCHHAIMPHMDVSHQEVAVPNPGATVCTVRTARDAGVFPNRVLITDLEPLRLSLPARVLRRAANVTVRMEGVVRPDLRTAFDDGMGADNVVRSHGHLRPDHRERMDLAPWAKPRARGNHSHWVDEGLGHLDSKLKLPMSVATASEPLAPIKSGDRSLRD